MAEPSDFLRPKRKPSIRPGAGYFQDSDTDVDDDCDSVDGDSRYRQSEEECENEANQTLLPVIQLAQRENHKAGCLYKQGGKNNDQGWKKRWMVFDGETLRYYLNKKTAVSLRIIPVSEMENLETVGDERRHSRSSSNLMTNSSRQFQFKIKCRHRTFLFGTDDPDNRAKWSNVIMASIIQYQKNLSELGNKDDARSVELTGKARINGKRNYNYLALRAGKLYYYYNQEDFAYNFPVHILNMETTNVQEIDGKLQLRAPPDETFVLQFDSVEETQKWKFGIEKSIARVLGDDEILDRVGAIPGNEICADCGAERPEWAVINLGIVICENCAGFHRNLGVDFSKVRSLRMDKVIAERNGLLKLFEKIGNRNANRFWCKELKAIDRITSDSSEQTREQHITRKYKLKTFCDQQYFSDSKEKLNAALFKAVMSSNLLLTMTILMSGADIHCTLGNDSDLTPYDLAKDCADQELAEFLFQNGADSTTNKDIRQNGHCKAQKIEPVYLDGYLEKTGPNLKGFNKRKCILEDGKLKYFKGNELKGTIYLTSIRYICTSGPFEKRLYCFDMISNIGKNTRTYRFSAADEHARDTWMSYIRKAMPQWQ